MVFIPKILFIPKTRLFKTNVIFPDKREQNSKNAKIVFFAQPRFCNGLTNDMPTIQIYKPTGKLSNPNACLF